MEVWPRPAVEGNPAADILGRRTSSSGGGEGRGGVGSRDLRKGQLNRRISKRETPAVLLVQEGSVEVTQGGGTRTVRAGEGEAVFFVW